MKKIMFNDRYGLTEAVLSGRKTQTRRIIPQSAVKKASKYQLEYFEATLDAISEGEAIEQIYFVERLAELPYQVGEVVAVAQSYKDFYDDTCDPRIFPSGAGWTNKMFVCADLMPHRIRITNVRVERLQDISDEDCIKEGVIKGKVGSEDTHFMDAYYAPNMPLEPCVLPQGAYALLIDRISGKGTWESNPWVFVYDFELIK